MRPYCLVSRFLLGAIVLSVAGGAEAAASGFTIFDAINEAVSSNPGVGEAAADRRATESGLRQSQALLLPQIHLDASGGPGRFNQQDITPPPLGNNQWLPGYQGSVIVRQKVFDGLASLNEVWRQAARVDASAYRVRERTELTALDAAEAYIDVVRFNRLITIATDNLTAHKRLLSNVEARFSGGRSGEGDLEQTRERVAAAEATVTISGLGSATLNHPGTTNPDGSHTLQESDLAGLTLRAGDDDTSAIHLSVAATTNNGGTIVHTAPQTINLTVNPVPARRPSLRRRALLPSVRAARSRSTLRRASRPIPTPSTRSPSPGSTAPRSAPAR